MFTDQFMNFPTILNQIPEAAALMIGSSKYHELRGLIGFYQTPAGVLVSAEITGLPISPDACHSPIFGLHIHEGERCTGNEQDPFADALGHYNPKGCQHPYHAGDLPPLFGNKGTAFSIVLTDRFTIQEIVGKVVIIHAMLDDFTTQPSGNSGEKLGCGVIRKVSFERTPEK